jgi:hypothetical protein
LCVQKAKKRLVQVASPTGGSRAQCPRWGQNR